MLVQFTTSHHEQVVYIETAHVQMLAPRIDNEAETMIYMSGTDVYSIVNEQIDVVAMKLGFKPTPEAGFIPMNLSIAALELPIRAHNILERYGIHTVGELMEYDWSYIADMRNMGNVSLTAIYDALKELGLELKGTPHWRQS
ncbi:DNA binding protein [Microbacterium phage Mazun]|nr:DNA binding protein [Microbacterium phage Mazun]